MTLHFDLNFLSVGFVGQTLLTVVCVFLVYNCTKYFFGKASPVQPQKHGTLQRRLGHSEEILDLFSKERGGTGNICIVISLRSKQSLSHQHVRDALVLLAKRQPMLRAFIRTMENGDKYFEIQNINEILSMIDFSTSDVKASNWQDFWFEQTAKQLGNGLQWRVVVLKEESIPAANDYANTLMFTFNHSCIDGISCVEFCEQFLNKLNEVTNGTSCVHQEIASLNMQPYFHDTVTQKRIMYQILPFLLNYLGLRAILKLYIQRMITRLFTTKQYNPFYSQFPPNLEVSSFAGPSRLSVKVFTEDETKKIIRACRENNCTVTGALTAAAHLAFCQLIKDGLARDKDVKLQYEFSINARRYCDRKPREEYLGVFIYSFDEFYMKCCTGMEVEFWKVAQQATRQIQDFVNSEACISNDTLIGETMKPRDLLDLLDRKSLIRFSVCIFVSSFGSFNFNQDQQQQTFKLHECFVNNVDHGFPGTFSHFNHTINGKMTWQIISNMSRVDNNHAEKFVNLCFARFLEIARGSL